MSKSINYDEIKLQKINERKEKLRIEKESNEERVNKLNAIIKNALKFLISYQDKKEFTPEEKARLSAYCSSIKKGCRFYNSYGRGLRFFAFDYFLDLTELVDEIYDAYETYILKNNVFIYVDKKSNSDINELIKSTISTLSTINKAGYAIALYPSMAEKIKFRELVKFNKQLLK